LALIAVTDRHWDDAFDLFERTVDANPDPATTAWAHYYLGQLELKQGHPEKATAQFHMTITSPGASARAREAAEKALETSSGEEKQ
jgi:TolA-binding protein